ncbi:MAG: hypothetical protein RMN24_05255 [Anaerolineae bacterium]|nr:hypothetical protein [Caldilineales bacterium]MDW8268556.1 hypothetical protein [Anaerolineae bacterium]
MPAPPGKPVNAKRIEGTKWRQSPPRPVGVRAAGAAERGTAWRRDE